jgi:hypothetical protein
VYYLENVFFYGLLTWVVIHLLDKWGLRDEMSGRAPSKLVQRAIECNFCLAHHIAFICVLPELVVCLDLRILFVPLFSAITVNKCLN